MKKRIAAVLLLICLPLALFAGGQQEQSGSAEETAEKVLQVGMVSAPMTFNVTATTGTYSTMPMDFVLGTLVSIDGDQEFQPWAASSWEVSEDGRTYTFNLNPDLNWHDGNPVVAEDVKMSLELLTHPDNNALLYGRLNGIEGVDEFYEKKADSISGVKVVNEKTVQITTKVP
ncbi:MAG: ABC transporter substrate-binding protein, partial [Spirochaetota bacterium]